MIFMFTNPALFGGASWNPADEQTFLFLATVLFCLSAPRIRPSSPIISTPSSRRIIMNEHLQRIPFGFAVIGSLLGAGASLPIVMAFPTKIPVSLGDSSSGHHADNGAYYCYKGQGADDRRRNIEQRIFKDLPEGF